MDIIDTSAATEAHGATGHDTAAATEPPEPTTDSSPLKRYVQEELAKTCALFRWGPEYCYEVRVLGRKKDPHAPSFGTAIGRFDDPLRLYEAVRPYPGYAEGVYILPNPLPHRMLHAFPNLIEPYSDQGDGAGNQHVAWSDWLLVDIDQQGKLKGVGATDEEHDYALAKGREVLQWLRERFEGALVLCNSGNGAHVLVRTDMPADAKAEAMARHILRCLDEQFTNDRIKIDPVTANLGRITKLYGTLVCKGYHHPTENPYRLSRVIEVLE